MITIFTPTYNRGQLLHNLYNSLRNQPNYEFEWLIVDDGSTDNTKEIVAKWMKEEKNFSIRYIYKVNGGKHTAINVGVKESKYEWFFIVDSDDYLTPNAMGNIVKWIGDTEIYEKKFAGISGLRCRPDGLIIGDNWNESSYDYIDLRNHQRRKNHLSGDKAEIYKTSILRKYSFPTFYGEKFLSEGAVWNRVDLDGYMIRWYRKPLVVCEYLQNGLTANVNSGKLYLENFIGYTYVTMLCCCVYRGRQKYGIIRRYMLVAEKMGLNIFDISFLLKGSSNAVTIICLKILNRIKRGIKFL